MTKPTLAVIGASLAGAKAAQGARGAGFDGRIVLVGDEDALPYERPPLSKEILRGETDDDEARVHPAEFYTDNAIELVAARATRLDVLDRRVELADGESVPFDTAVLATGATPRRLDVPGAGLPGVFSLRTLDDARHIREAIRAAEHVVVVGAGWIGSEVAASARQMGVPVTLADPAPTPLHAVVGERVGEAFRRLHADNGVRLRLGRAVTALRGTTRVEGVTFDDGTTTEGDVVIVGVGVMPRVEVAETAVGLRVDNGVVVDAHLETTVPGVFAAGDVANAWHPVFRRHMRVEHWANALNQGEAAGRNAAGARETYERIPYFFSDQYDLGLEYVGHHDRDDSLVIRGDLDARTFIAFWRRNESVTAAMAVNIWDVVDHLKALITTGMAIAPAALADPDAPLADLVGTPASGRR